MYATYFGLTEEPFAITPDPHYLYMSDHHREALAHLFYGLGNRGGFVQLTGEIGTGKTTICRSLLSTLPENVDVALVLNPALSVRDLLLTMCDELHFDAPSGHPSTKVLVDGLNQYLLAANARGRKTVLIIDEAQNLSTEVLEQVRLLTNLETEKHKLLQIFLIGQPELRNIVNHKHMRQLAQRITARFHLGPLTQSETHQYVRHRLAVAGGEQHIFTTGALRTMYRHSRGVPRTINILCDRALLGAYVTGQDVVSAAIVRSAAREIAGEPSNRRLPQMPAWTRLAAVIVLSVAGTLGLAQWWASYLPGETVADSIPIPVAAPKNLPPSAAIDANADTSLADLGEQLHKPRETNPVTLPAEPPTRRSEINEGLEFVSASSSASTPVASLAHDNLAHSNLAASDPVGVETVLRNQAAPPIVIAETTVGPDIKPAVPTADQILAAALVGHVNGPADLADAERVLAEQWFTDVYPRGDPRIDNLCATAAAVGLKCLSGSGDWNDLRSFNRPALLTLRRPDRTTAYGVLLTLDDATAKVAIGGTTQQLTLGSLESQWTGGFLLLWRPPLPDVDHINPKSSVAAIEWLRNTLSTVQATPRLNSETDAWNWPLTKAVMEFQRRSGLEVDGTVGAATFMALNTATHPADIPRLNEMN
jgi:general secretion pathway protein A